MVRHYLLDRSVKFLEADTLRQHLLGSVYFCEGIELCGVSGVFSPITPGHTLLRHTISHLYLFLLCFLFAA